jgi:hypothetical protein
MRKKTVQTLTWQTYVNPFESACKEISEKNVGYFLTKKGLVLLLLKDADL